MENREKVWFAFKMLFLTALVIAVIWTDIQSQMAFTENTRAGLYDAAYQRQHKGE